MNTKLKVLVVEDNPAFIRLVGELLLDYKFKKFDVLGAESLSSAMEILKNKRVDVILLDLGLTDSNGINTFLELNKIAYEIPVIILTGVQDEDAAVTAISEGAQDYFVKGTFDGNMLAKSILFAIERKHNENAINEYAEIIENTSEAIFSITAKGIIKSWNRAAEIIYEYTPREVIGHSFINFITEANNKRASDILELLKSGVGFNKFEIKLLSKSGKKINSLVTITPFKNKIGIIIGAAVLAQDITAHKSSETESAIQLRVAIALAESPSLLNAAYSVLKSICEILDFQVGEIWAFDPGEDVLRMVTTWSKSNIATQLEQISHEIEFHSSEGIIGKVVDKKIPIWETELNISSDDARNTLFKKMHLNCYLGFPIIFQKEILGVIAFYGSNLEMPSKRFMITFEVIGKQIGHFFKRKRLEKDLLYLAEHDVLTGLANKLVAEDTLRFAMQQSKIHQSMVAIIYLDLDYFKDVNDTLGHDKGDLLLQEVARRLQSVSRETDLVARFGGDEFAVVLPGIQTKENIDSIAQKILDVIMLPFSIDGKELHVTASIGVSIYPYDGDDVSTLIRNADLAMYQAKKQGRNNYQFSSPQFAISENKKVKLEADLHQALQKNEFVLCYQPIVDVLTNQIVSLESLIRWKKSDHDIILPIEFIPLLERSNLILQVGEWVIRTACNQLKIWQQLGLQAISVNISVHQLSHHLLKIINDILSETNIKSTNLVIDISESVLMKHNDTINGIIDSLNAQGIRTSIDNFGTGYFSFSYLKTMHASILKIDKSFIDDLGKNKNAESIIEAIIKMAHALKMKAVAVGVETKEQLDILKQKECDTYQGYYFSQPLLPDELIKLLKLR